MKPFDYYSTDKIKIPRKSDFVTIFVYDKGEVLHKGLSNETPKSQLMEKYPGSVIQEFLDNDSYREALLTYRKECSKLHNEFRDDLFNTFNVEDNPKRFKCYELAIDWGGDDPENIYEKFYELVDLIA